MGGTNFVHLEFEVTTVPVDTQKGVEPGKDYMYLFILRSKVLRTFCLVVGQI